MHSKLFRGLWLVFLLVLPFLPIAEGIREKVLRSDTSVQVASANLNSTDSDRTMSFAEAISKNSYGVGLRLPDSTTLVLVGIGLIGLAAWAQRRAKRDTHVN